MSDESGHGKLSGIGGNVSPMRQHGRIINLLRCHREGIECASF